MVPYFRKTQFIFIQEGTFFTVINDPLHFFSTLLSWILDEK